MRRGGPTVGLKERVNGGIEFNELSVGGVPSGEGRRDGRKSQVAPFATKGNTLNANSSEIAEGVDVQEVYVICDREREFLTAPGRHHVVTRSVSGQIIVIERIGSGRIERLIVVGALVEQAS